MSTEKKIKGRPTKDRAVFVKIRDFDIGVMSKKGYPLDYIAGYYNLSKGRIVQILKKAK